MDVLYDNLDNYEDENILHELRRENCELKRKLEEYTATIDKLQKDFDTLSGEFKKLEMNYSSLLKTAKEEIGRKTEMIKNLNKEKDMMVLNAIQNKNVLPGLRRSSRFMDKSKSNDRNVDVNKSAKTSDTERKKSTPMSSEETITSASTDNITLGAHKTMDRLRNTYHDSKENNETNAPRPKPMSIGNRRKSMPALRSELKISSDEDDDFCPAGNKYQKKNQNVKTPNILKTFHDKNRLQNIRHRTSETSSMDDKYSNYHESSKDYRSRNSRYDSCRNRDQFDSQRHKRRDSPDRFSRATRNYSNDTNSRLDHNRYRVLESPPPDRYSYQQRNRDARPRFESNEYYPKEKNRDRSREKYSAKHKLQHDTKEPSYKRRRTDSTHNWEEEKVWDADKGSIQISATIENLSDAYCQSPDYSAIPEAATVPPIREIRNTAVTQLEDPRLFSRKYVSCQGVKGGLSAVCGINVDLKEIDTSTWDIQRVEVPRALTRRPSQCSEDFVYNVNTNNVNPVSNMSLESGEIETEDFETLNAHLKPHCKSRNDDIATNTYKNNKFSSTEKDPIKNLSNYTIPKLRKEPENTPREPIIDKCKVSTKNIENLSNKESFNNPKSQLSSITENAVSTNVMPETKHLLNILTNKDYLRTQIISQDRFKPITKVPIEGDLDLSEESNDNLDIPKRLTVENKNTIDTNIAKSCDVDCIETKAPKEDKTNCDATVKENTKTTRSRRKCQKQPNKESAKEEKEDSNIGKKSKSRKEKKEPKEIKAKFTELFGETTSSLITPEDLGILQPQTQSELSDKYLPICEDAQDAVLMKPVETKDPPAPASAMLSYDTNVSQDNTETETVVECNITNTNEAKKKNSNNKEADKTVSTNNENHCKPTYDPSCLDHIIKTSESLQKDQPNNQNIAVTNGNVLMLKPDLIKALATSTPYKEVKENPVVAVTSKPETNSSNNRNHDIVVSIEDSGTDQFSNNETLDSQTDVDVPDVRIFVKRRRRVIRKSKK